MSKFFSSKYSGLTPYTPGEQPQEKKYIKLNTNESPFPPSPKVLEAVALEASKLQLYSDPESRALTEAVAKFYSSYGVGYDNVLMTNGSDEILNFAFMAFCDKDNPIVFPDITYGFYPVFAELNGIPYETIPLREDFTVDYREYCGIGKNIVIANPNAPTGILMPLAEIEEIVKSNPDNVVIIDEAYIDFTGSGAACGSNCEVASSGAACGGAVATRNPSSALNLVAKYDNLLVAQTFSKSRSLAGARLGFGIGSKELIRDLNTIKYSTNPYNVNRLTQVAGIAAIEDVDYFESNCNTIIETREYTKAQLEKEGFKVLPSKSNFLFIKADYISGLDLYQQLKKEGVLVRHFETERLRGYNRVTIGSKDEVEQFLAAVRKIKNRE